MRTHTLTVREGEDCGPVDWFHPTAVNKPDVWREAEQRPGDFTFNGRPLVSICMYDGWPYWKPTPAVLFVGPIGSEWAFFNSYGVNANSIEPRARP